MNEIKSHNHRELIVKRFFSEIGNKSHKDQQPPEYFEKYFDRSAMVVCGDPGSGKTTSFKHAAQLHPNAKYVTVRDFINLSIDRC